MCTFYIACVSARGCYIPPMVVFKRKGLTEDLIDGEVPGTIYGMSKSGWMDGELFSLLRAVKDWVHDNL